MKNPYPSKCDNRDCLLASMLPRRDDLFPSREEYASEQTADRRLCADSETCQDLCCAMNMLRYLCCFCSDPLALLQDCREIFERYYPMSTKNE